MRRSVFGIEFLHVDAGGRGYSSRMCQRLFVVVESRFSYRYGWLRSFKNVLSESYKVLILKNRIESIGYWHLAWHKLIPSKVSCLVWRIVHGRLPTKENLIRRDVIDRKSLQCVGRRLR